LLDTHVLIWAVAEPTRLSAALLDKIVDPHNQVSVSTVAAWEIAIKRAQGKLAFPVEKFEATMRDMGYDILPVLPAYAIAAGGLPRHHGDPFDRLLIAQAQLENMTLVSRDRAFAHYGIALTMP
jgi:PIN domain nuclease of toxin-antitoxin system